MRLVRDDVSVANCGCRNKCIHGARPPQISLDPGKFNDVSLRCVYENCTHLKWMLEVKGEPRIEGEKALVG